MKKLLIILCLLLPAQMAFSQDQNGEDPMTDDGSLGTFQSETQKDLIDGTAQQKEEEAVKEEKFKPHEDIEQGELFEKPDEEAIEATE